jgi:hypothetical protein
MAIDVLCIRRSIFYFRFLAINCVFVNVQWCQVMYNKFKMSTDYWYIHNFKGRIYVFSKIYYIYICSQKYKIN